MTGKEKYIVSFVIMLIFGILGVFAHAVFSGIMVGLVLSALMVAFVPPRVAGVAPALTPVQVARIRSVLGWIAVIVLPIALFFLFIGITNPDLNVELDRTMRNGKKVAANGLKKMNLKSEAEVGVIGTVNSDAGIYDSNGEEVKDPVLGSAVAPAGMLVKSVDLESNPDSIKHEGLTAVILPNKKNEFYGGVKVWLVSSKVDWPDKVRR